VDLAVGAACHDVRERAADIDADPKALAGGCTWMIGHEIAYRLCAAGWSNSGFG
jgi:hypothetical protein